MIILQKAHPNLYKPIKFNPSMSLRALKKEVEALPCLAKNTQQFQDAWVKPIRSNTNSHIPFLKNLSEETKKQVNQKLMECHSTMREIKESKHITQKLNSYAHHLINLKLTQIRNDPKMAVHITNTLLNDEALSLTQTISEIKQLEDNIVLLKSHYKKVNMLLQKDLSLDEAVFFMELPHRKFLATLQKTAQQHNRLVRNLGRNFVSLAKQTHPQLQK